MNTQKHMPHAYQHVYTPIPRTLPVTERQENILSYRTLHVLSAIYVSVYV